MGEQVKRIGSGLLARTAMGVVLLSLAGNTAALAQAPSAPDLPPPPPPPPPAGEVRTLQITSHKTSDAENAQIDLSTVAGGTNLISSEDAESHRAASTADLLALQPGIYASSAGGEDSIKLSIRGSAINRGTGYFRTGVLFTFDGLPVTGPSGTPYELLEPLGLDYTEVLRGGNAFDQGALALGGGINFVTNTGRSAPGEELRLELGSWDYRKAEAAVGGTIGDDADYYLAAITSSRAGFENHSDSRSDRIIANFGYQISPEIDTRFFFRYAYTDFAVPGQLTKGQVASDPSQANAFGLLNESRRIQPGSEFFGNVTSWKINDSSALEFGLLYHNFPIAIEGSGTSANTTYSFWTYGNIAEHLKYTTNGELFGRPDDTLVAFYNSTDIYGSVQRYAEAPGLHNYGGGLVLPQGALITTNHFNGSSDRVLLARNELEVSPDLWLTAGIAGTETERDISIDTGAGPAFTGPISYGKTRDNITPKFGIRYDIEPKLQVFANVSKAVEPRNDWDGVITPQNGVPTYQVLDVNDQSAWMEEVGGRGQVSIFQGSLSYYRSEVRNEILTVTDPVLGVATEENAASPTTHQGVEFGLDTVLWHDGDQDPWASGTDNAQQRVVLRQSYTYSNFYFNNDPTFHHNVLPGIPPHYYQGALEYDHPSGFYGNLNVQYASNYYIDYANTFKSDAYAIYGARIGYAQPGGRGLDVYLEGRNLGNKHYATDISSPVTNAHGKDAAVFDPGDGLGVFSGIAYRF